MKSERERERETDTLECRREDSWRSFDPPLLASASCTSESQRSRDFVREQRTRSAVMTLKKMQLKKNTKYLSGCATVI